MSRMYLSLMDSRFLTICALALGISVFPLAKAHAQVPITDVESINFVGGISANVTLDDANETVNAITVPNGVNVLITDVMVANFDTELGCMEIFNGPCQGTSCNSTDDTARTNALVAAAEDTLVINFESGIGFTSGTEITLQRCPGRDADLFVTLRGYRFTIQ